jgi:nicotinamide-nucleotide amidase
MFPRDIVELATKVLAAARAAGLHVATAESCTGGLVAAALTEIPGSSDVVDRGFVVYTNDAKNELLDVRDELLEQHGAVSEQVARAMAQGALLHSWADVSVAVTGIAGPSGGTPQKPVGLVHIATAREGKETLQQELRFGDIGREAVRLKSVEAALTLILRQL